jgi:hypothetical protein
MTTPAESWQSLLDKELAQAERARAAGNEGMARVCARRAAGIITGEYFRRRAARVASISAYDRLRQLALEPDLDTEVRSITMHLLLRITPDHTLPVDADLIADTRRLAQLLLVED